MLTINSHELFLIYIIFFYAFKINDDKKILIKGFILYKLSAILLFEIL